MPKVGKRIKRYIFKEDRDLPKNEQPVFLIRVAPKRETLDLLERLDAGRQVEEHDISTIRKFMGICTEVFNDFVIGWENWKTEDGEEIVFKPKDPDNWEWLSFPLVAELLTAIQEVNGMSEEEEKN